MTTITVPILNIDKTNTKYITSILYNEIDTAIVQNKAYTTISVSKLYLQKGIQIADIVADYKDKISSLDGTLTASINSEMEVRINSDEALASSIDTLTASYQSADDNINVSLTETKNVVAGYFNVTDGTNPQIGNIKIINDVQYQYLGGTLGENSDGWVRTDYSANSSLYDFVSVTYPNDIANIQDQIDKNITSWFYDYPPTNDTIPWSTWITDDNEYEHVGDLFYDSTTGYSYRFIITDTVYSWIQITDSDITLALSNASKAQDTADNKRRVFIDTPVVPYDIGDLWITDGGDLLASSTQRLDFYYESDWSISPKYTDNTRADEVAGWVAGSSSLVVDPTTGEVTGWQYGDGSGFDSEFKISADNIVMDGNTTFVATGDNVSLLTNDAGYTDDTAADAAQATADAAVVSANAANDELSTISSDTILSMVEKPIVIRDYDSILSEQVTYDAQADLYVITTEKDSYDTAISDLTSYLNGLTSWNDTTVNTTIVAADFNGYFNTVYSTRSTLLDKIADVAKAVADAAQTTADSKVAPTEVNENVTSISGSVITTGVIYNSGADDTNYTMKIDLDNGEIYIA